MTVGPTGAFASVGKERSTVAVSSLDHVLCRSGHVRDNCHPVLEKRNFAADKENAKKDAKPLFFIQHEVDESIILLKEIIVGFCLSIYIDKESLFI
ncbi:hypothetical protein L2E82_22954 [Cichorium intybus]|uniref:Uncharacterized protein n=1 Tax=Cichorium intybus TaxID=13427 RepID=A0ACB9DZW2_CICIN|nr:hypothetical protein L2E82_22954 [Cichorium intybus]